jgi:putative transcription factor
MNCEICGKKILGRPTQISIERSLLTVCQECIRFGVPVDRRTAASIERTTPKPGPRKVQPPQKFQRREGFDDFILMDNFGDVIKKARESLHLSREEFAKKLGEKDSVIRRVESGEMHPTAELTKKIEKLLKISLKENVDNSAKGSAPTPSNLTLGDVAVLKEGRTD